jgi:fermentation-respiration switch protein FrsA (DUF1100 family)
MKKKIAVAIILTVVLFISVIWLEGGILSSPTYANIGALPSDLVGQDVQISSESGTVLRGWWLPRDGPGAVILMHGVRSNRQSMLGRARFLSRAGYSVLLFDFQAHGESRGRRITFGYLESRDASSAVDFVRRQKPLGKIGVIGVSMGGAASLLATPPLDVQAMVLESVYPTIEEAVADRLSARAGNWAGIMTPLLTSQLKPRLGVGAERLRPIEAVKKISAPKLFIFGTADRHTKLNESLRLVALAMEPKDSWAIDGAGHVDLYEYSKTEYQVRILDFFSKYLQGAN